MFVRIYVIIYFICLFGFYGVSTFVSYLMSNPFLYKYSSISPFSIVHHFR